MWLYKRAGAKISKYLDRCTTSTPEGWRNSHRCSYRDLQTLKTPIRTRRLSDLRTQQAGGQSIESGNKPTTSSGLAT